jgi:hypothetical protein
VRRSRSADDDLRRRVAAAGVSLFRTGRVRRRPFRGRAYEALLVALVASRDARLRGCLPCVLAVNDGPAAARAARAAARRLPRADRATLGLLYRLARALCISRGPDLEDLLGRRRALDPVPFEPASLPAPEERAGERCLARALEAGWADLAPGLCGDAVSMFDTWLAIHAVENPVRVPA